MNERKLLTDVAGIHGRVGWKGYTVEDLRNEGPLVLGANDITLDNQLDLSNVKHLSREKYEESPEIFVQKEDILVVKVGSTIGKVCIINTEIGEASINPNCVIVRPKIINPYYLYYFLCSPAGREYLINNSSASGQPALNQTDLGKMPIPLIDDINQEKISFTLNNINNKIYLNNKIISELESMAKTIYDYWFLQFEFPNEEGKPYKSSGGKMVWNEELKREIPEGWEVKELYEIESNIITGKTPSTSDTLNYGSDIPFVTIGDIRGNMFVTKTEQCLSTKGAGTQFSKYIPKDSLCVTCIASPGLVGFTTKLSQTNQQINSIIFNNSYNKLFLYFTISDYFKFSAGAKTGNTFKNMNKKDFESIKLVYPSINVLKKFESSTEAIRLKIMNLLLENQELTSLRDFLLPLLMNGQVGFKEVTK